MFNSDLHVWIDICEMAALLFNYFNCNILESNHFRLLNIIYILYM